LGYAGTGTRHIAAVCNINVRENSSSASYNSFAAKAECCFTNGFTLLSSFTWSHNIDFVGELLNNGESVSPYRDHYNPGLERASSNQDRRLAWVTSYVYELPSGAFPVVPIYATSKNF
jgi:hypothetical protein